VHKIINSDSGIYLLEIYAAIKFKIDIKRYSHIIFPPGYYYYTGSAQKNLLKRIERHCSKSKTIHWNIDHITDNKNTKVTRVFIFKDSAKSFECELTNILHNSLKLAFSVRGFGNSDCNTCTSHLLYHSARLDEHELISSSIINQQPIIEVF